MIELEQLPEYIQTLKQDDWDRLFSLLPEIEATKKFSEVKGGEKRADRSATFPYQEPAGIVNKVVSVMHGLNLVPIFDWMNWTEGRLILENHKTDYSTLETITLCKLFTTIVRADRFNDGFLVSCFANGTITKIIKAIEQNQIRRSQSNLQPIRAALWGVAVGDALGVPVEFNSRQTIAQNPVVDMIGYGTYHLPAGTWSDDSSLTFCLAEALTQDFDLKTIGQNFVKWYYEGYWTPAGNVFDVGMATQQAILRLKQGKQPDLAGGFEEADNGNGSLMRILPLLFYLKNRPIQERFEITKQVSAITHGHIRSIIACFYYLEYAYQILSGKNKFEIYADLQTTITNYLTHSVNPAEITLFKRLLHSNIHNLNESQIQSDGYVLHTLEASIWCLLTTDNYAEAVLKAVNLGSDTDTTGAVTGGLAGLLYGFDSIPTNWVAQIARKDDIENLASRLASKLTS